MKEAQEKYEAKWDEIETFFEHSDEKNAKKEIKMIKPAVFHNKMYIETEDDVDDYIHRLKAALLDAVHNNNRVKIT